MKIAIVHPYPVHSRAVGGTTRVHTLVRHLAARHRVFVLTHDGVDAAEAEHAAREMAEIGVVQQAFLRPRASWPVKARWAVGRDPYFVSYNRNPALESALAALGREQGLDLVHVELATLEPLLHGVGPMCARTLAEQELMSRSIARLRTVDFRHKSVYQHYIGIELSSVRRFEAEALRRFDRLFAITDEEAACMAKASGRPVEVLPHVVDTSAFVPAHEPARESSVLFVGNYAHHPNVEAVFWLMERVWPIVRAAAPQATIALVGPGLDAAQTEALRALGALLPGRVEDLVARYQSSAVFANPVLSGGGMRGKILEAFACGVPVVSTSVGLEGATGEDAVHWRRAETPKAFAAALLALLRDPAQRARMAEQARRLVEAHYDARCVMARLEAVFEAAIAERRANGTGA